MEKRIVGGRNVIEKVSPSEVKLLHDDEVIIVSRAQINARLAFACMEINDKKAEKDIQILKCAINKMLEQEKEQKSMVMGAKMRVGEVKEIFSKIEKMPQNSFARVTVQKH